MTLPQGYKRDADSSKDYDTKTSAKFSATPTTNNNNKQYHSTSRLRPALAFVFLVVAALAAWQLISIIAG